MGSKSKYLDDIAGECPHSAVISPAPHPANLPWSAHPDLMHTPANWRVDIGKVSAALYFPMLTHRFPLTSRGLGSWLI